MLICTRYVVDCMVSFFYLIYTNTHGIAFENKFTEDPLYPKWLDYQRRCTEMANKWYSYWFEVAETSDIPIYFFRFEDVIANPGKELKEIYRFVLGMESIEGTVIEHRIDEVMGWSTEKN